ncbi:heterokaryon incompatibility protein-domain-containing protein [Xylariaceae sp. FL0662B]|nr:heterokaryon incompatibility protein-domain-containing protein [Xylariaceae sp. FL0662B]
MDSYFVQVDPAREELARRARHQDDIDRAEAEMRAREKNMESAVLTDYYKYTPISASQSTRLLVLSAGGESARLTGSLKLHWVGEEQDYKALSYVWGEQNMMDFIYLDGKRLDITRNLGLALRKLRSTKSPKLIWVDQICIDQKNTVERNRQVKLMHAIFKNADKVVGWLGPDPDGYAAKAFQLCRSLCAIFSDELLASLCKKAGAKFDWIPQQHWAALKVLSELPWFRRAWITQEIGTDTPATMHWGTEKIDWDILSDAMKKLATAWELKKTHKINTTCVQVLYKRFVEQKGTPGAAARRNFIYQLCLNSRNQASDPRDYVFSQLGHYSAWVASEQALIIQPDYENPVETIYHEIAIRALKTSPTLMILNAVAVNDEPCLQAGKAKTLPSWVPRWDYGRFHNLIGYPGRYNASPARAMDVAFKKGFAILVAKGIIIDTISKISEKFISQTFNTESRRKGVLIQRAWTLCNNGGHSSQLAKYSSRPKYLNSDITALEAFLSTLAPEKATVDIAKDSALKLSTYPSGVAALAKLCSPSCFSTKDDPRKALPADSQKKANWSVWAQNAEATAVNRKFAITKKGHFTMVPPTTKAGDTVCVLFGGETPYILRDTGLPYEYQFIGEAYVYGMMNGEALELAKTSQILETTFKIL